MDEIYFYNGFNYFVKMYYFINANKNTFKIGTISSLKVVLSTPLGFRALTEVRP